MAMRLNRKAYEELIAGDVEWCEQHPYTLERQHTIAVLKRSVDHEYPPTDIAAIAAAWKALANAERAARQQCGRDMAAINAASHAVTAAAFRLRALGIDPDA
jgi:hypothetical protein